MFGGDILQRVDEIDAHKAVAAMISSNCPGIKIFL